MFVRINGNDLNVEVLGPDDAPVLIAHHGGGGIGSLAEPKATFGRSPTRCASWSSTGGVREVRPLAPDRGIRQVPGRDPRFPARRAGAGLQQPDVAVSQPG
jgi:hypothetical protein